MQCNEIEGNPYDRRKKTHRKMGFSFCSSDEAKRESRVGYIAPRFRLAILASFTGLVVLISFPDLFHRGYACLSVFPIYCIEATLADPISFLGYACLPSLPVASMIIEGNNIHP